MRPIAAAVFFTLLFSSPLVGVGYFLGQRDCQRTEPQMVVGPRGERGLPGANGTDGKPGQDCDCSALKAEAVEYVRQIETRLGALEAKETQLREFAKQQGIFWADHNVRIEALEKSQCKCKCR